MARFEEQYEEALETLEYGILGVYKGNPEFLDSQVDAALEALHKVYRAEHTNFILKSLPQLRPNEQLVFDVLKPLCELCLGRNGQLERLAPLSLSELMDCLNRIRKSIELWNKEGGKQGYLGFIDMHL